MWAETGWCNPVECRYISSFFHADAKAESSSRAMNLLLAFAITVGAASAFSPGSTARVVVASEGLPRLRKTWPPLMRACQGKISMANAEDDEERLRESDVDSADSGPKILMPPTEFLGAMPSEADSFAGYLAPYALLVLLAFGLAGAAFAFLVLKG